MPVIFPPELVSSTPLLRLLPSFAELRFERIGTQREIILTGSDGDSENAITIHSVIRRADADLWQAASSMVQFHLGATKELLNGSFIFELLWMDMTVSGVPPQWDHLYHVIANMARALRPNESRLVVFHTLRGVLTKHMPLEWGKLSVKHAVSVYERTDEKFDLFLKKLFKAAQNQYIIIHDMSRQPILDRTDEMQSQRCQRLFASFRDQLDPFPVLLYYHVDGECCLNELYGE
jgi:hypothetical protein